MLGHIGAILGSFWGIVGNLGRFWGTIGPFLEQALPILGSASGTILALFGLFWDLFMQTWGFFVVLKFRAPGHSL